MLSIIIPAHNEEHYLPRTLKAARDAAAALGEPFEIIVVNDASTDRTAAIAQEYGASVVSVDRRQISMVRNDGAAVAKGDWLVFVDADSEVNADVLIAARDAIRNGAIGGGSATQFDDVVPLYARLFMRVLVPAYRWMRTAAGCFMYSTRDAFDAIGGFDATLFASEEVVFSRAMRRHGRFVIVRETVITSGRKLRQYSAWTLFGTLIGQVLKGRRAFRRREGLDVWYNAPREP